MKLKWKSERGATGADIVVAAAAIMVTMIVVSMIYYNTNLSTRNVTRTSGATRIATNIMENIEAMAYADFVTAYTTAISGKNLGTGDYASMYAITDTTVFDTTIPTGYTLYISAVNAYGSKTSTSQQYDLVRQVNVSVVYTVGESTESVDLSTVKSREVIGSVNAPDTSLLTSQGILKNGYSYYPIKYSSSAYYKTTTSDTSWYSYTDGEWARVIVSNSAESTLFNSSSGKLQSGTYTVYVWVPRFTGSSSFSAFAYLNTNYTIGTTTLTNVANNSTKLTINTCSSTTGTVGSGFFTVNGSETTGRWVAASSISSDSAAKILNTTYAYKSH